MFVCDEGTKLGSTDGEVLRNTLVFTGVIKLGVYEVTDLGYSAGVVTGSSDSNIEESLLGILLGRVYVTQQLPPS